MSEEKKITLQLLFSLSLSFFLFKFLILSFVGHFIKKLSIQALTGIQRNFKMVLTNSGLRVENVNI